MGEKKDIKIRLAEEKDMNRARDIYAYYVENTAVSFEYEAPSLEEFTNRFHTIRKKYPYIVAEVDGEVIGYAYAASLKGRAAYDWCVETTVYLDKEKCGGGVGRALYEALERYLAKQNITNLYACIVYPYPMSVLFHEKMGYKQNGLFTKCGYKFNQWYDMVWMEKMLGEHKLDAEDVIWFEDL